MCISSLSAQGQFSTKAGQQQAPETGMSPAQTSVASILFRDILPTTRIISPPENHMRIPARPRSSSATFCATKDFSNFPVNTHEKRVAKALRVAGAYADESAAFHRVDCRLIVALIAVETGGLATPHDMIHARSPKGARGLMQLLPSTAAHVGGARSEVALVNPAQNIHYGTKYFRELLDTTPSLAHAIMAYNRGPGGLETFVARGNDPRNDAYVRIVLSYARILGFYA